MFVKTAGLTAAEAAVLKSIGKDEEGDKSADRVEVSLPHVDFVDEGGRYRAVGTMIVRTYRAGYSEPKVESEPVRTALYDSKTDAHKAAQGIARRRKTP